MAGSWLCSPSLMAPIVDHGAVFPPASFHAVRPRLLASAMKSARHLASASIPSASSWARIAAFAAWLAAPVSRPVGLPSASSCTPGDPAVSPSAFSAAWLTRGPVKPPPVIHTGLFGAASVSSSNVKIRGSSSCVTLQPPNVVQIHLPSGRSAALSAYAASAFASPGVGGTAAAVAITAVTYRQSLRAGGGASCRLDRSLQDPSYIGFPQSLVPAYVP